MDYMINVSRAVGGIRKFFTRKKDDYKVPLTLDPIVQWTWVMKKPNTLNFIEFTGVDGETWCYCFTLDPLRVSGVQNYHHELELLYLVIYEFNKYCSPMCSIYKGPGDFVSLGDVPNSGKVVWNIGTVLEGFWDVTPEDVYEDLGS